MRAVVSRVGCMPLLCRSHALPKKTPARLARGRTDEDIADPPVTKVWAFSQPAPAFKLFLINESPKRPTCFRRYRLFINILTVDLSPDLTPDLVGSRDWRIKAVGGVKLPYEPPAVSGAFASTLKSTSYTTQFSTRFDLVRYLFR